MAFYPTAADLDDDGTLELILGNAAFDHDGSPHWASNGDGLGFAQVGNLDDDGPPEILVTGSGMTLLGHDGEAVFEGLNPTGGLALAWWKPASIHDIDGNGTAEFLTSSGGTYSAYTGPASVLS